MIPAGNRGRLGAVFALGLAVVASAAPPRVQLSPTLYQTEHCLFVIDASVDWSTPTTAFNAVYGYSGDPLHPFPKLENAFNALVAQFPANYFSVCYMANTGASNVPNYLDYIPKPTGINESYSVGQPANTFLSVDACRYNLAGNLFVPMLAVYDHELGHAWGARAFYGTTPALSNGHWLPNSTVDCQMGATYSDDGGLTVNKLYGDPAAGFRWQRVDNLRSNDIETFSEQTLYLIGVREKWPTAYVLNNPVYHADHTAGASSVDTFDHAGMLAAYGPRNPNYTTAPKRFKLGFVYIARDLAEVDTVYQAVEKSADQICNGEAIDKQAFRFQTPFLANTKYRASVDGLLADLDGNATPTLTVTDTYVTSTDGTAVVNFTAADPDGPAPTVSVVPAATTCSIVGNTVQVTGLPDGVHFFTLKAVDAGGKKMFGHFVIEVQRPVSPTVISVQPALQSVVAGSPANFAITAAGATTYQWFRRAAGQSSWNSLAEAGAYTGTATAMLTVASATTMNGDEFLCMADNGGGPATSAAALLVVDENAPVLTAQPVDRVVATGNSVTFAVTTTGVPATFGYFYYQWQRLPAGSGTWVDVVNGGAYTAATTASFHVQTTVAMSGDQFRCQVANTAGNVTSTVASLTVGAVPAVTTQPASTTVSAGQTAHFTVVATGTAPLSYQWKRLSVPVPGGTSATLDIPNAQAADAGSYTVTITNAFGIGGSNVGSLTVNPSAPVISAQPQPATILSGQPAAFSVTAAGTNPLSYQWRKNSADIPGATGTTYSIATATAGDAGSYDVVITNSVNPVTSAAATLTVLPTFDSWAQSKFTAGELLDANLSGPNAVFGRDGLPNLVKYALGLEPKQDITTGLPAVTTTASDWVYTYTRPDSTTDVSYAVEVSPDLVNWTTAGVTHELVSAAGGVETWRGRYPLGSAGTVFFRLRVVR